jgi:hypothetical protein
MNLFLQKSFMFVNGKSKLMLISNSISLHEISKFSFVYLVVGSSSLLVAHKTAVSSYHERRDISGLMRNGRELHDRNGGLSISFYHYVN